MTEQIITERMHLFTPNIYVGVGAKITGEIEPNRIEESVERMICHTPALQRRIVLETTGKAYYLPFEAKKCLFYTKESLEKIQNHLIQKGMDIWNGELLHFYIRETEDNWEVILFAHHLLGDGLSIQLLLNQFLKSIGEQQMDKLEFGCCIPEQFPKHSKLPRLFRRYLYKCNQQWKKETRAFQVGDWTKVRDEYRGNYTSILYEDIFGKKDVERVRQKANSKGITLNSYLMSVLEKVFDNQELGFAISVREDGNLSIGNFASGGYVKGKKSRQIHKQIQRTRKTPFLLYFPLRFQQYITHTLIDAVVVDKYMGTGTPLTKKIARLMNCDGNERPIGVSNLGKSIIKKTYGDYQVSDVFFIAPVIPYCHRILSVVEYDKQLHFIMHSCEKNLDQEKQLFQRIMSELREN